jgi:DNA-directed RNA polymerase subunit RPC12/RpoP
MRKPRPAAYNPVQALHLIASDRNNEQLRCPSCTGKIDRDPGRQLSRPSAHVTLRCTACGRIARYIAGAA